MSVPEVLGDGERPSPRRRHSPLRGGLARLALAGAGVMVVLTLAAAPFSRSIVEQWSRLDVESRSRLVFRSIEGPIQRATADGDDRRLAAILQAVARDDRIQALGLCDVDGRLRVSTRSMPSGFDCAQAVRADEESFLSVVSGGRRVLVAAFPVDAIRGRSYLVVLHDLGYIDARLGQVQRYAVAGLAGFAILLVAIVAVLVALVFRSWMGALRAAVEDVRAGGRPGSGRTSIEREIRDLLTRLDPGRTPTETPERLWTPDTLHDLLGEALPGAEVIIVSNREPYIHNRTMAGVAVQRPASGLVSALEPVMRATGGTWIAHGSGSADAETVGPDDGLMVPPEAPAYRLRRAWISEEEQDGYYYGLANEGLWPLCHIAFVRPTFREEDWRCYQAINARFAAAVVQEARTDDPIVLVQDYHFALAPRMIREQLPKATIITFWHIPWPNAETFGICPWKEAILEGLLGSSIVGFHTQFHCNNFFETVDRFIESRIDRERRSVTLAGSETLVRPYPISIEWPPRALIGQPDVQTARRQVRAAQGLTAAAFVAVGIERFDYTKGILDRMRAIDLLLEKRPEWKGRFSFVQVAAPTRSKLPAYSRLQEEAQALAAEINDRHGGAVNPPIRLLVRHHEPGEVFELFRAADVCVVSSLHDGMNLVAKEFVAARDDEQGVLVLSSFTGAAREMSEALIVNPYDAGEMADALHAALCMPASEQRERMRLMRQQVQEQNVYRWAGRMLVDAARIRQRSRILDLAADASLPRGGQI